ncbi:MAG: DnaD domain protein [Clostridium lundense]|jgi:predicted phage replisome organizer|nr:DnaD domain protein [Clostridium lundense]
MAEVKWIKITTNMFDDEKIKLIDAMPERDTIHYIWIRLLVQAGKTNANGYIFLNENVPYTEEMLSTIFNRPLNSVRLALKTLMDFGMIEIQEDRLIKITNWSKHQNIEGMEKVREQNRIRKQKQRAKEKNLLQSAKDETCGSKIDGHSMSRDSHAIEIDREIDIEEDIDRDIEEDRKIDKRKNLDKINQAYFNTFYRQISGTYLNQILKVMDRGDYTELLIFALDVTKQREQEQGKIKGFKYTMSILESWINKGYKTPEDVKENEINKHTKEGERDATNERSSGEGLKEQGIGL